MAENQNEELLNAILTNNIGEWIQQNRSKINEKDDSGLTPLHYAVLAGQKEAVETLVKAGANINEGGKNGHLPLQYALYNNDTEMVKTLIENKADVNATDDYGQTPLHTATYRNDIESAQVLLENGADPNKLNKQKRAPLHLTQSDDMRDLLRNNGAKEVETNDRTDDLRNSEIEKKVRQAIENNDSKVLAALVSDKSYKRVDDPEKPLLFEYVRAAAKDKDEEKIKKTLQTFKEAGIDINQQNARGNTLFHSATESSFTGGDLVIKAAKELGGNPDKKNKEGTRPVHYSAYNKNQAALNALQEAGADLTKTDAYGKQALHIAAMQGNNQMVDSLLHTGANINAETDEGKTPLHYAKDEKTASVLLKWGANVTTEDNYGKLPGDYIEKNTGESFNGIVFDTVMDSAKKGEIGPLEAMMASEAYLIAEKGGKTPIEQIFANDDPKAYATLSTAVSNHQKNLNIFSRMNNKVRMPDDTEAMLTAVDNKSYKVLEWLAEKNKDGINRVVEIDGESKLPLHTAIEMGDAKASEILIAHGARVSEKLNNQTAEDLCYAIHKKSLSEFLKQAAEKEANTETPANDAAEKQPTEAMEGESEKTAEDANTGTSANDAAEEHSTEAVEGESEKTAEDAAEKQPTEAGKGKTGKTAEEETNTGTPVNDAAEKQLTEAGKGKPGKTAETAEESNQSTATASTDKTTTTAKKEKQKTEEQEKRGEKKEQPKVIHAYAQQDYAHAQQRISRLGSSGRETALKNLKRMEELGLVAGGKENSNADILLYKMAQANALYSPNENVITQNEKGQPTRVKMTEYMKGNHRAALAALSSKELSDEELAQYAQTVNAVETSISTKGYANLNVRGVQGRYSYNTSKQAGFVEEKTSPKEQEAKPAEDNTKDNAHESIEQQGQVSAEGQANSQSDSTIIPINKLGSAFSGIHEGQANSQSDLTKIAVKDSDIHEDVKNYTLGGSILNLNSDSNAFGGCNSTLKLNASLVNFNEEKEDPSKNMVQLTVYNNGH